MTTLAALHIAEPAPPAEGGITAAMLKAGRRAFDQNRRHLSDLWEFFPEDRDAFLAAIYRAMAAKAEV